MNSLRIRLLSPDDLPFADSVRILAGWNQTVEDWGRFLNTAPSGCFLAEWEGQPAGTATTTLFGPELAWIGMILVHPDLRRRGIGRALLLHCIEHLRSRGARCIKLDATPLGKTVYDQLGFRDELGLKRWVGKTADGGLADKNPAKHPEQRHTVSSFLFRGWELEDAQRVAVLDAEAFGVARTCLLALLAQQSKALIAAPSEIQAYGMIRPGARAAYLGPVVAENEEAGVLLLQRLAGQSQSQTIYCDIPDSNQAAVGWAERSGFTVQRPFIRMFLGENAAPGNAKMQFAIAGPEVG